MASSQRKESDRTFGVLLRNLDGTAAHVQVSESTSLSTLKAEAIKAFKPSAGVDQVKIILCGKVLTSFQPREAVKHPCLHVVFETRSTKSS
jgi:hypothetical protein